MRVSREQDVKRVYYLSMEFLMGRSLTNALYNLQISGPYSEVPCCSPSCLQGLHAMPPVPQTYSNIIPSINRTLKSAPPEG